MPESSRAAPESPTKPYPRFTAWTACHELTLTIYRLTSEWPAGERYQLTAQARRAAFSAAVNIVEGSGSPGGARVPPLPRCLDRIAVVARDVGLLSPASYSELEALRDHAGRVTWGLYRAIARKAEPTACG